MVCDLAKHTLVWTMNQHFAYGNMSETTTFPKPGFFNLYPGIIKSSPAVNGMTDTPAHAYLRVYDAANINGVHAPQTLPLAVSPERKLIFITIHKYCYYERGILEHFPYLTLLLSYPRYGFNSFGDCEQTKLG